MNDPKAHAVAAAAWRDPKSPLHERVKSGEFASKKLAQWRSDLRRVADEVSGLYVHRHVYEGLGQIVGANPALQSPNLFLSELFEWYVVTNVVQANRDAERASGVISLANVLGEIADRPDELSRRAFRKLHTGKAFIPSAVSDELGDSPEHDDVVWLLEPVYDDFADPLDRERLDVGVSATTCASFARPPTMLMRFATKSARTALARFLSPRSPVGRSTTTSTS